MGVMVEEEVGVIQEEVEEVGVMVEEEEEVGVMVEGGGSSHCEQQLSLRSHQLSR